MRTQFHTMNKWYICNDTIIILHSSASALTCSFTFIYTNTRMLNRVSHMSLKVPPAWLEFLLDKSSRWQRYRWETSQKLRYCSTLGAGVWSEPPIMHWGNNLMDIYLSLYVILHCYRHYRILCCVLQHFHRFHTLVVAIQLIFISKCSYTMCDVVCKIPKDLTVLHRPNWYVIKGNIAALWQRKLEN